MSNYFGLLRKTWTIINFPFLDDEDFGGDLVGLQPMTDRLSCNFVDCIGSRELGLPRVGGNRFFSERLSSEYGTRHMLSNGMMKETSIGNYWQILHSLHSYTLPPKMVGRFADFRPKMAIFRRAGMRKGGLPPPIAFQYLILMIWRACDLNLVMISFLDSKCQDFKQRGL